MKKWIRAWFLGCIALVTFVPAALAQDVTFPKKGTLDMTVLFPAGTSADITARLLAQGMGRHLGANVLAVNRPGAGGAIGYRHVLAQKPDGYSMVWNSNSVSTAFHSGQMQHDFRAFDAVARALIETPIIAVQADSKWKSLKDLIADAKARPGKITVANSGVGSHTHLTSVALFRTAGVEVLDVPYGAAQVVPNLLGGHVDVVVQLPGALAGHVKAGTVRVLAAVTAQRDPTLPDVPTAMEHGHNISLEAWRGVAVPRGTPRPVIAMLEAAVRSTVQSPEFITASEKLYIRPAFLPAAEFAELIAKEDVELARMMQIMNLRKSP